MKSADDNAKKMDNVTDIGHNEIHASYYHTISKWYTWRTVPSANNKFLLSFLLAIEKYQKRDLKYERINYNAHAHLQLTDKSISLISLHDQILDVIQFHINR